MTHSSLYDRSQLWDAFVQQAASSRAVVKWQEQLFAALKTHQTGQHTLLTIRDP